MSQPVPAFHRIIGDGEMAELARKFDWSSTSLGPIETWPDILVTTVNMMLGSRHPMFLWWGPNLIQFYNDGYRPSIRADKHPGALGQHGAQCWPEIWSIIGPQIDAVMSRGESTWNLNQLVPINRNGKLEEVYWTYSYSPIRNNLGVPQGTLVVCSETTEQVLSERRLRTLLDITSDSVAQDQFPLSRPVLPFAQALMSALDVDPADVPFAALYLVMQGEIVQAGSTASAAAVADPDRWPLSWMAHSQRPLLVEDLQQRFGDVFCPPWPEPVNRAYLMPLRMTGASSVVVLVFGISPRLPFDDAYQTFFKLIGNRIAGLLQSEIQQQELSQAAKRFSTLVEANPFGMIIGGLDGSLCYVNPAFLQILGYTESDVRAGRVRWDRLTPPEYEDADARAVQQLRASGRCDVYEKVYIAKNGRRIHILIAAATIEHSERDPELAAFLTDLTPLKLAQEALLTANDDLERKIAERTAALEAEISERTRAEINLQELTGQLLRTQDDERRHMARELHDNAGQTLAVLSMNLSALQRHASHLDAGVTRLAVESRELADDLSREIRTMSYLLHPPLLDESGLASALQWYVDGFSQRSKIVVELDLPQDLGRLPRELELVVFRVVQEGLTNIHRHSESPSARIYLTRSDSAIQFEISDHGKGIDPERQRQMTTAKAGVGIRGMEERVRQFRGTLQIHSDSGGTKVLVVLPVDTLRGNTKKLINQDKIHLNNNL
jgi:PAS domain S-box-containing protein